MACEAVSSDIHIRTWYVRSVGSPCTVSSIARWLQQLILCSQTLSRILLFFIPQLRTHRSGWTWRCSQILRRTCFGAFAAPVSTFGDALDFRIFCFAFFFLPVMILQVKYILPRTREYMNGRRCPALPDMNDPIRRSWMTPSSGL